MHTRWLGIEPSNYPILGRIRAGPIITIHSLIVEIKAMSNTTYRIEHHTGHQWEPIPEGEFSRLEAACEARLDLENNLGWHGMRIVEVFDTETDTVKSVARLPTL